MKLGKWLFMLISFLVLAACNNNVKAEDLETYQSYQNKLEETIMGYLTGNQNADDLIAYLDEFEKFMEEKPFPEELKKKQIEALQLYREGITKNNPDKISNAAFVNLEAMDLFEKLTIEF